MSNPPNVIVKLSDTLSLCEYQNPNSGHFGFWLYDETRGMNLSMRAKTAQDAFVEAIGYYQERLNSVLNEYNQLKTKVDAFIGQFAENDNYE